MLMKPSRERLSRRSFLGSTAVATAAVIVAACGGQTAPAPTAAPKAADPKPAAQPTTAAQPAAASKPADAKPAAASQAAASKAPPAAGPVTIRFFTGEDDPTQVKVYVSAKAYVAFGDSNTADTTPPAAKAIQQAETEEVYTFDADDPEYTHLWVYSLSSTLDADVSWFG